ncbi:Methylmalonyl-CoA mutase [compost metagenome]
MALPTDFSARIARNTQLILQHETGVTKVVDPLAGSYYVESLTNELAEKAWELIEEVEKLGGMTKAVADGLPKRLIEEAATLRQAKVDRGQEIIVGVNKFRLENEDDIDILAIDNSAVRKSQIARLEKVRRQRDPKRVEETLAALSEVAKSGTGNLLEAAVEAARARATVGEISDAMRKSFGDHAAVPEVVGDIYGPAYSDDPEYKTIVSRLSDYGKSTGKPKILVAKLGQDGHDRGAKVIASAFGDIGFEVLAGPLFQTPEEAADLAVKEKVQVVGMSSLAAGHRTLAPQLVEALKNKGAENIIVVVGGVIPRQDYEYLLQNGVAAVFGPGTNVLDAANSIIDLLEGKRRNAVA